MISRSSEPPSARQTGLMLLPDVLMNILAGVFSIRQRDAKARALRIRFHQRDVAAMGLHEFARNRQSQARTRRAGGRDEGLEQAVAQPRRNARPVVRDVDERRLRAAARLHQNALLAL